MKDYTKLSQEEKDALVKKAMDVGFQTETDYGNCIQSCLYGLYCAFPDFGITKDMQSFFRYRRRHRLLPHGNLRSSQRCGMGHQPMRRAAYR